MRQLLKILLIASYAICMSLSSNANNIQEQYVINHEFEYINLDKQTLYLIDGESQLDFVEVLAKFKNNEFDTILNRVANFTGTKGNIWLHYKIVNNTNKAIYLNLDNLFVEDFSIFRLDDSNLYKAKRTGYLHPYYTRELLSKSYTLQVSEVGQREIEFFVLLNADSQPPLFLPMRAGTLTSLSAFARYSQNISVGVIGILLVMFFYNLVLYFILKDKLYFIYCVYILTSVINTLWFSGYLFEWFWPNNPELNPYPWTMGPFFFMQVLFVNKMLRLEQEFKLAHKFSYFLYLLSISIVFVGILPFQMHVPLVMLVGSLIPIYIVSVSVTLSIKKNLIARVLLIGWAPLLTFTFLNILMVLDVISYTILFDIHAIELCMAWEITIFSMALGYRFNIIRKERKTIQEENLRIVNNQRSILEKMVFERTEEIMAQNDELIKNQEIIKIQNERLETQNKAYERLKEMILKQNQHLESAVEKRTYELANSNEQLKKHYHQLEQFSYIAAHNLRAPVARILGLASILEKKGSLVENNGTPAYVENENEIIIDKIVHSAKDLDSVIRDLGTILDVRKFKNQKAVPINICELVNKICERFRPDIEINNIVITTNIDIDYIVSIPLYIDNIFHNLISNAIKFRDVQRQCAITVNVVNHGEYHKILVSDNGQGFDIKTFKSKLYEPFQRFHEEGEGKGLGLFLIKQHIDALKGKINIQSELKKGTRVVILIPNS